MDREPGLRWFSRADIDHPSTSPRHLVPHIAGDPVDNPCAKRPIPSEPSYISRLQSQTNNIVRTDNIRLHRPNLCLQLHRAPAISQYILKSSSDVKYLTMAASALNEERELAINPIIGTSVQHNNQVRHQHSSDDRCPALLRPSSCLHTPIHTLTIATGHLEHT
jgi:hypothetical protein